jgi:hypothetical protein
MQKKKRKKDRNAAIRLITWGEYDLKIQLEQYLDNADVRTVAVINILLLKLQ